MPKAFYVSFWGLEQATRGGRKEWVWIHSCWCRRLNRLGRLWRQAEMWHGACRNVWRIQVTIEKWECDRNGRWEPVEYL